MQPPLIDQDYCRVQPAADQHNLNLISVS
jgi:hypothetical protein